MPFVMIYKAIGFFLQLEMYKIAFLAFLLAFKKCKGGLKAFFSGGLEMIRAQLVD